MFVLAVCCEKLDWWSGKLWEEQVEPNQLSGQIEHTLAPTILLPLRFHRDLCDILQDERLIQRHKRTLLGQI